MAGYWSYSEYSAPIACKVPEACLGISPTSAASTNNDGSSMHNVDTADTCAAGYSGLRCGECTAGFYALLDHCYACGSAQDQQSAITLTILFAVGAMTLLAVAVAFLAPRPLTITIAAFCVLQELAMAGVTGAASSPIWKKELSTIFTWLNLSQCAQQAAAAQAGA